MDIKVIRQIVQERGYRITGHASVEGMKDGMILPPPTVDIHFPPLEPAWLKLAIAA